MIYIIILIFFNSKSALIYAANERFNFHVGVFAPGEVVFVLTLETADRRATLVLPDRADVSSALAMHELLIRTQMGAIDAVDIDAAAVVKLDGGVLQLLLGWLVVLESQHIPWHWQSTSENFQHVVALAGLSGVLRLSDGKAHEHAQQ